MNPNPLEPRRPAQRFLRHQGRIVLPVEPLSPQYTRNHDPKKRAGTRSDLWLVGILLVNLIGLGLIAYKKLPLNLMPQTGALLVVVALGLVVGISGARRRHWLIRVFLVVLGFAAAVAACVLVPSLEGLNLWTAWQETTRQVSQLNNLPVGDAHGFNQGSELRERLLAQFPFLDQFLQGPIDAWTERSVTKWANDLSQSAGGDLAALTTLRQAYQPFWNNQLEKAELEWFERSYHGLAPGDFSLASRIRQSARKDDAWARQTHSWESAWAERTVTVTLTETDRLLLTDPGQASSRLRQVAHDLANLDRYPHLQDKLLAARRKAFLNAFESGKRQARSLLAQDRFQVASDLAQRLHATLLDEAAVSGLADEFAIFCENYRFLADLARQAGKSDPK
jgi:hypothetical protein